MKRDHTGIYVSSLRERAEAGDERSAADLREYLAGPGHAPVPTTPDPRRAVCAVEGCGRRLHYRRTTYGPNGRKGGWQHTGDGLAQYHSWK
jgi:hypothetical protein